MNDFMHETRFRLTSILDERRPKDGLLGIPALFAIALLGAMAFTSHQDTSTEHQAQLEAHAQNCLDKGQFMEARLTAKKLQQAAPTNRKASLLEARALRGMGKERDAVRLLARSAPIDHPGYAPAHVMQAAMFLAQQPQNITAAKQHIDNALQADPANEDALELAARFSASTRDWKSTLAFLQRISLEKRADLLLMKATALQYSNMKEDAIKCARQAEEALRAILDADKSGTNSIRFSIAVSLSLQRQFEQALQWIVSTTRGTPSQEERQVLGGIYLAWSRHLKDQAGSDKLKSLQLLEKGIQISPESQDLIMAFLQDCDELASNPAEARQQVERVLNNGGVANSFMHYYLGVQDWKQGNRDSARTHFELASASNPGFSVITNNLAMAIASVSNDQNELEKALSMMDELVKKDPQNPFYLDTRGHVNAKLGRFKEAVGDFERSLPNIRDQDTTHAKLADLYQHLGMEDLAAQHRNASLARMQSRAPATAIQ